MTTTEDATKPAATQPRTCACGCGEATAARSSYRMGHDARHASQVATAITADPSKRGELLATLASPALRAKAAKSADRALAGRTQDGSAPAKPQPRSHGKSAAK